jgi:hypothetical protein
MQELFDQASPLSLLAQATDPQTGVAAWWSPRSGGMIGGIGGAAVGVVSGLLGAATGVLAPRGIAKAPVLASWMLMLVFTFCVLIAGIIAAATGQPYSVYYILVLTGSIGVAVLGPMISMPMTAYAVAQARAIDGTLPKSVPTMPGGTGALNGQQMSPTVVRAMLDLWQPNAFCIRWTKFMTGVSLAGLVGGSAWAIANVPGSIQDWMPGAMMGMSFAISAFITGVMLLSIGSTRRQLQQLLDKQKLDARALRAS